MRTPDAVWQQQNNRSYALLQDNKVVSALMGLFNSFMSREQNPNHHPLDPTALREALACLPGSRFQIGEFLCPINQPCIWQDKLTWSAVVLHRWCLEVCGCFASKTCDAIYAGSPPEVAAQVELTTAWSDVK